MDSDQEELSKPLRIDQIEMKNINQAGSDSGSEETPDLETSPMIINKKNDFTGKITKMKSITPLKQMSESKSGDSKSELETTTTTAPINGNLKKDGQFGQDGSAAAGPRDKKQLVYMIMLLHGIAVLMPWNSFINAKEYFTDYKLVTILPNGTQIDSPYREYFLSYLGIASQLPNVIFTFVNLFYPVGDGTSGFDFRIYATIIIEFVLIIITIIMAVVDTSNSVSVFFFVTMIIVVILNICNAIYQNSLWGLASILPIRYNNAIITGNNLCGTFFSVMNIITIAVSPNLRIATIYFFSSAVVILVAAIATYASLKRNPFYKYHDELSGPKRKSKKSEKNLEKGNDDKKEITTTTSTEADSTKNEPVTRKETYLYVLRYCWVQCFNVFLVFFVTLATFPAIQAEIRPVDPSWFINAELTKTYFIAIFCFLVFNFFAMVGAIATNFFMYPGPKKLWILCVARLLFLPFFLFCNYVPEKRKWAVLIKSDLVYFFGSVLMAFTNGYCSSLAMMYAPRTVPNPKYAGLAGMMAASLLILGIFLGINFGYALAWLVRQ